MGTVEEVRERLPIEQVVGEVVQLKRAGSSLKGLCPFHGEKSPSFIVTPSRGMYKCFGCSKSGDIFSFIMETRHLTFGEALRELAAKASVVIEDPQEGRENDSVKTRILEMNAAAAIYYQSMLAATSGTRAREYLERRSLAPETVERFGLGFAPDSRDGLCARLRAAGYGNEEIVGAGLAIAPEEGGAPRDRFHGRLMFPIRDAKGRISGFGGRLLVPGEPKYLNSPATPAFEKSRVLYAIDRAADAIRASQEGIIVEGYVDAIRAHQGGFTNVVATLGTAITEAQLRTLARLAPRLILALDADPAGQKAAVRAGLAALDALPRRAEGAASGPGRREGVQVSVATLPDGQDPDEAIAADPEIWRCAVAEAVPLMDHYITIVTGGLDRSRPEWRQEAIDALVPAIAGLDGVGLQQTYLERLAELTGVDARYLRDITPGGPPGGTSHRRSGRRGAGGLGRHDAAAPGPASDPVRLTEEYLLGLLLTHRPFSSEVRAALALYVPLTRDLQPLFAMLLAEQDPDEANEEAVERLVEMMGRQPMLGSSLMLAEVGASIARLEGERAKRRLQDFGVMSAEVDDETLHEIDRRAAEEMVALRQVTARLEKEQSQRWRQAAEG